jgi:hypothetical protein
MATTTARSHAIRRLTMAIAIVCLVNVLTIILMYSVAGFFGPLNDLGVAVEGILIAVLAWKLYPSTRGQSSRLSVFALIAAIVGAALVVVGSAVVIFRVTGWFFAGLITVFGYAVIGLWVVVTNYLARRGNTWPHGLARFGLVIGVIMMFGLLTAPSMLDHVDSLAAAPWSAYVAYAGGLGWFVLLPIWSVWLGRSCP